MLTPNNNRRPSGHPHSPQPPRPPAPPPRPHPPGPPRPPIHPHPPKPPHYHEPPRPITPIQPPPFVPPSSFMDYGPAPYVVDIKRATMQNNNYRTALWTGHHLQVTLMTIPVGGDIGLEVHHDTDQFLSVESGQGLVLMGDSATRVNVRQPVFPGYGIFVPAGTWHNVANIGSEPLKLYSTYGPPHHPHGTVNPKKPDEDKH